MKPFLASLGALILAACASAPASAPAANQTVNQLTPRGTVQDTDQIPNLPNGATTLEASYASDLKAYVLAGVTPSGGSTLTPLNGFAGVDPTGAADSTTGIQTALNTGENLYCDGIYKISGTLSLNTTANHGQVLAGSGATNSTGSTTAGRCIFRPTTAMTGAVFKIDGTPFSGYVQSFGFENLAVDMVNVTDLSTNIAFEQVQAFDGHYSGVRVVNYGNAKLSWLFKTGAYTTTVRDCQGGLVSFAGSAISNATTTITFTNSDILGFTGNYYVGVTTNGGAVQRAYNSTVPIVYLAAGTTPYGYLPNTSGLYVAVTSEISNTLNFTSVGTDWESGGGYAGTYNDGTHGSKTLIPVLKVDSSAINTTFINPAFSGMYLWDSGVNTRVLGQQSQGYDLNTGAEQHLGNINVGPSAVIQGFTNLATFLDLGTTTTFSINASTGAASFLGMTLQPASNGDGTLSIKTASGTPLYDFTTNGGGLGIENGALVSGYTDSFSTQSWLIDSSVGTAKFRGLTVRAATDGNGVAQIQNAAGSAILYATTNATASSSSINIFNGAYFGGYSDTGGTNKFLISAATGAASLGAITSSSTMQSTGEIYPGTGAATQASGGFLAGAGNPSSGVGSTGDFYFRIDCVHASTDCVWHKESGGWVDLN